MKYSSPCRLCFDGFGDEISLSETIYFVNESVKLTDMINICIQLKIDENDHLPQSICGTCKFNMVQFYEFRQKCYETDLFLRIKPENVDLNEKYIKDENIASGNLKSLEIVSYPEYALEKIKIQKIKAKKKPKLKIIHKCDVCFKVFRSRSQLRDHQEIHSDEAKYLCVTCGQTFKSKHCWLNHSKRHSGLYECKICDRGYSSRSQLEGHIRVHTGERPFKCKLCNSAFKANASLKIHFRRHTGDKPYKCRYCEKCFVVSHHRRSHELVHGDKDIRPFKCVVCSKDFQKKDLYFQHKKIHLDEREFKCEYCDKEFVYRKNWKVHLRTHTGEKPYACPLCSKAFAQRVCMRTHVDKAHPHEAERMKKQNFCPST